MNEETNEIAISEEAIHRIRLALHDGLFSSGALAEGPNAAVIES